VTQIRTLIRDPYAIYAEKVLRLRPLDPLRAEPEPRLRGRILHRVVQDLLSQPAMRGDLSGLQARLLAETARMLTESVPWPVERRFWMQRMEAFSAPFLKNEQLRSAEGEPLFLEHDGAIEVADDFILTGRPDRIDRMSDGRLHILDYKTGELPSLTAVFQDERQLPLEAIMAEAGAFGGRPAEVGRLTYVRIAAGGQERQITPPDGKLAEIWDDLARLVGDYRDAGTGYAARAKWNDTRYAGSYDHLARLGEWQPHDPAEAVDVGGGGDA
jgi:ATP-dependent helicase/nuclease subunit B